MENKELITKATQFIRDNAENHELAVQHVADAAGFSLDYFNRLFLGRTGFTVMAYVNYIRLKKAAILLRTTSKTILEIALESGYSSHEGFTKAFQKKYGIAPSEYRKEKTQQIIRYGEVADRSVAAGFIHDNKDFLLVDADEVMEYLLDIDAARYGRICSKIKYMGLAVAAPNGDFRRGFVGVGDDRKGGCFLELVTDDMNQLVEWLKRFGLSCNLTFSSEQDEEYVSAYLKKQGIDAKVICCPLAVYQGALLENTISKNALPETISVRKLGVSDLGDIQQWAEGKRGGYIQHLLNPNHYADEAVLEYGVFEEGKLIAIVGCGMDEVMGLKMNDGCIIRFAEGVENPALYRPIYVEVTRLLRKEGITPYDNMQFGEYAKLHGDFTSEDVGYRIVNWEYHT